MHVTNLQNCWKSTVFPRYKEEKIWKVIFLCNTLYKALKTECFACLIFKLKRKVAHLAYGTTPSPGVTLWIIYLLTSSTSLNLCSDILEELKIFHFDELLCLALETTAIDLDISGNHQSSVILVIPTRCLWWKIQSRSEAGSDFTAILAS